MARTSAKTVTQTPVQSQADVLGSLSYAMMLTMRCGLTRLAYLLAELEHKPVGRLRQQLREFYYEAEAKRGAKRREVVVQECFADLLAGVLKDWQGKKELALALDASQLDERFVTLSISVVYRGCGIPVAFTILPAGKIGAWRPHWQRLLGQLKGAVDRLVAGAGDGRYGAVCCLAL